MSTDHDSTLPDIAIVIRAFAGGGAQRDSILLANAIHAEGVPVAILALRAEGGLRSILEPGIPVYTIPGGRIRYAVPGLRRLLGGVKPRLVMSSEANLNLCCLAAVRLLPDARRPKLVLREVGSPSIAQRYDPYLQNRIAYRLLRRLYRHADLVVTLTEGARADLIGNFGVPASKVSVMTSNAVIPPAAVSRLSAWDGEAGREPGLILSVGRLSPEKDQQLLLRAMALIATDKPWRVGFIGEGSERASLEALARALGLAERIFFPGYVADPFEWLKRASLLVSSSVYEGLGNAIIEALACGTPVVATDCPYGPREILVGGRFGTLVPPGDAGAMAVAITAALAGPVDRAGLMRRGLDYTTQKAAQRFLGLVAEANPNSASSPARSFSAAGAVSPMRPAPAGRASLGK